jgi:hypothetical protein
VYDNASSFAEGLAVVNKNGMWGFIDADGKEVIPLKYSYAVSFNEGFAKTKRNGKWLLIDKHGKESPNE